MGNLLRCPVWRKGRESQRKEVRTVKVGKENSSGYSSNRIVTSKYTMWNFVPKNLFEQFRRIANFYFLVVAVISYVLDGPVASTTSILPLAFVVLVTMVKQGYEDYVRHRADTELNNRVVWVFRNACLQKIPSEKIKVGEIVKVFENEDAPCDLVLLTSSQESSKCYVTTSGLDGETNLKTLYCPRSLKRNIKTDNLKFLDARIECEEPTSDLYKFNGRIEFSKMTSELIKKNSFRRQTSLNRSALGGVFPGSGSHLPSSVSNGSLPNGRSASSLISRSDALGNGFADSWSNLEMEEFRGKNSSSPQLGRTELLPGGLRRGKTELKRHLTLPKRSFQKHQKTLSNVANVSWDPAFFESLENLKWMSKRKGSERENLVDPLTAENLFLKGSTLKNTEFVYGCAVYTGQETKMALNSKLSRTKFSVAEKSINKLLMFQLVLLLLESIASTILNRTIKISHGASRNFDSIYVENDVPEENGLSFGCLTKDLFLFILMYNYLVPISLYVTLELTKFVGALLFKWDVSMYDEPSDQCAVSNTSDVNEELGVVEYLFTDKTGTLTENNLRFHSCSLNGISYQEKEGELYEIGEDGSVAEYPTVLHFDDCPEETQLFLLALTLCNTVQVIVEKEGQTFRYTASSPDEKALVEAMQRMNIIFANDDDFVVVNVAGNTRIFQKLEVLEFSSSRKRMSVIVKDENENIRLYCKGAESAVIPKVATGPTDVTLGHVSDFAKKGLRTLVVGYKSLTEEEYRRIEEKVQKARETLSSDREQIVNRTYEEIEDELTLLGATGVEDELQDGVEDTLKSLREAGIKVWMLTGDKVETALEISLSCGHLKAEARRLTLTEMASAEDCKKAVHQLRWTLAENEEGEEFGLVVDGKSLAYALDTCSETFRDVCMRCSAVICCRLSPIQKSQVVRLVKSKRRGPIVAAIGDGANDVSMLKEAHVGLGIMGKEGRQATLSSDFAFAKFKFLKRVLLVHGHWYYVRTANLVQYFFYKNIVFIAPQFYFFFFSGYSVQQLYEPLFYVCYNTIFTALPVLLYGISEQDYSREKLEHSPELYRMHKRNLLMTWKFFALWMAFGVWHSLVVFFIPTLFYWLNPTAVAQSCIENLGTTIFHNSVILVNLKLLLHSRFWSAAFVASIAFSIISMFLLTIIYSTIYIPEGNASYYMSYQHAITSPNYWLLCLVIWVIALIPDVLYYVAGNARLRPKHCWKSCPQAKATLSRKPFHDDPFPPTEETERDAQSTCTTCASALAITSCSREMGNCCQNFNFHGILQNFPKSKYRKRKIYT